MAKSKHRTTGAGTHRERIQRFREQLDQFRKATLQNELNKRLNAFATTQETVGPDTTFSEPQDAVMVEEAIEERTVTIEPDPVKDDGFGHGLDDQSLADTMREYNGMVNNDKHEQLMDTFVQEASTKEA